MNCLLLFVCLLFGQVLGFLVQNGGSATSNTQPNDQIIQNLLNLILNEQNSRLQLQNDMRTKLNELSARLVTMEQSNADVSKQLTKEKNNREHLEQLYAALERRVLNIPTANDSGLQQYELHSLESKLISLEANMLSNLTDVNDKLNNLTTDNRIDVIQTELHNAKSKLFSLENMYTSMVNNLTGFTLKLDNLETNRTEKHHTPIGFTVGTPDKSSGSILKYKVVYLNKGGDYNQSTGVFTCRIPGLYSFTATMFKTPGGSESYCYFNVNTRQYMAVSSGIHQTDGYLSGSQTSVFMLKVGDRVYLSTCGGINHTDVFQICGLQQQL